MNKNIKIIGLTLMIFVLSCEENDPLSFYGGQDLVELVEEAWSDFRNGDYEISLEKFYQAKDSADVQVDMDAILIHSTYGNIYTGIGWCNLRWLYADIARDNFIISQGYELYSFGTSVGLMAAYYELGYRQDEAEDNDLDISLAHIDSAITIGHWIFSSGMPEEFEHDATINVDDVRLLMAKSYLAKGDLSNNVSEEAGALYWILQLDSGYSYVNSNDPLTWNLYDNGEQRSDNFGEVILEIIIKLAGDVFPT